MAGDIFWSASLGWFANCIVGTRPLPAASFTRR
jgi:hypothetical protein